MYNLLIQTVILILLTANSYPQISESFPVINKEDLPDAKFLPVRKFTGESLFGYMNGGAELYREYGIISAVISEFDLKAGHYKCEVFEMNGPEEAFGIFSVSKFRCSGIPPLSGFICQTRYQLQICKGSYYISIINKSGLKADSITSLMIGKILTDKIKEPAPDINAFLPGTELSDIQRNGILVKGKLGLMNGATAWEDYFNDITGYCAVILPAGGNTIISVRFSNREQLLKFCEIHKVDPDKISGSVIKISSNESVNMLKDNHLIILYGPQ